MVFIPFAKPCFFGNETKYVNDALESTWISDGKYIDLFEKEFSQILGASYGISSSNGTTALHLALLSHNIGPGDEVIVPDFSFITATNVTLYTGATPVFADVDKDTWCIDPQSIANLVSDKTKAIIPVHTYGNVCEMEKICRIAQKNDLIVVEDAAEALLSRYKKRYAGSMGDSGCFSFQSAKTITMGEGGIILTNDIRLDQKMRILRSHGMRPGKKYWHDAIGYNFRLTNIQAALGYSQLEHIEDIIAQRKRIYETYRKQLINIKYVTMQKFSKNVMPVVWAMAIKIDQLGTSKTRDDIMDELSEKGIETRPGFYPASKMPPYKNYRKDSVCHSESISSQIVLLPTFLSLDDDTIKYICDNLEQVLEN